MQCRKQRGDRWDETKWREERWETTLYCSLFILLIYYLCSVPTSSSAYACQGKGEGAIFRGCDAWTWSGEESTSQSVEDTFAIPAGVAATAQFPQAATAAATALKIPQQITFSRQNQLSSTVLPSKPAQPQLWAATPTQSQQKPTSSGLISPPQQQASQSLAHTDTHTLHHSASAGASYGLLRENRRHLLHWSLILNIFFHLSPFSAGIHDATSTPCIQHRLPPLSCIQCDTRRHRAYTLWRLHFLHHRHPYRRHSDFVQEDHHHRNNMVRGQEIILIIMRHRDSSLDQLEDLKLYIITNLFTQLLFTFVCVCVFMCCVCVRTLN